MRDYRINLIKKCAIPLLFEEVYGLIKSKNILESLNLKFNMTLCDKWGLIKWQHLSHNEKKITVNYNKFTYQSSWKNFIDV